MERCAAAATDAVVSVVNADDDDAAWKSGTGQTRNKIIDNMCLLENGLCGTIIRRNVPYETIHRKPNVFST